ncbi:hypothetical protein AGMMS49936_04220 [Endomicrobiia bacterium]|nr:hypothetical protein AGMMS49936_04220 [Endomicrobiia bacterium]
MKKSVLVIVSVFVFSGVAFSSEINIKTGVGCFGEMKMNGTHTLTVSQKSKEVPTSISTTISHGPIFAVGWLFPLNIHSN